jgi:hypothetical protein
MARLTKEQWASIRSEWEYSVDKPSYGVAAKRAAEKYGFSSPDRASVTRAAQRDEKNHNPWVRQGALPGINQNAHRKADALAISNIVSDNGEISTPTDIKKRVAATEDSEDLRATVLNRHRNEWKMVQLLRQEALKERNDLAADSVKKSFERAKLAKITAELTQIQQAGERRAWGLDDMAVDVTKLSDAQLQDLIAGKMPK